MARPTTKTALLKVAGEQFEKLWTLVDTMTEHQQTTLFNFGDTFLQKLPWREDRFWPLRAFFLYIKIRYPIITMNV